MIKDIAAKIKNPGAEFRGAPFWAWNSRLDADELHRQTAILKEMGFGGFFMHARVGLNTGFLSDQWFELVGNCVSDAEKSGMIAYLYDEDRWPSGTAGGLVTQNKLYRIRVIAMSREFIGGEDSEYLATFAIDRFSDDGAPVAWHRCGKDDPGEKLHFFCSLSTPESWYNGGTYVDTLNPEAIAAFIKIAYGSYAEKFQAKFGKSIGAIFTDEPNYRAALFSENAKTVRKSENRAEPPKILPWTGNLAELFQQEYGYDILDDLPELFYEANGEEFSKLRCNYFNLITKLFVNAYTRQIGAWCGEHNLPLTGHMHWEDTLTYQRHQVGAAMRSYEYMQNPGIDQLTEHLQIFDTAKQCVSMAHQFDRKWRLTECYGCTGWDFPLAGHKALGEWQYALGINFRCPHLAWYSMAGDAKRDYPASIFFQSPWYKKYRVVEDHFARLGAALSEGEEVRNILVIHPIESTWGWKSDVRLSAQEAWAENQQLIDLRNCLLAANLDFDYGDEEVMSRHGKVSGNLLAVAKASYQAVVIPKLRTIRSSTLQLLQEFAARGGRVFYLGEAPAHVDAEKSVEAEKVFAAFSGTSLADLPAALECVREISLSADGKEVDPLLSLIRRSENFQTVFLCNVGHELGKYHQEREPGVLERTACFPEVQVKLRSVCPGNLYELDLDSGDFYRVESAVNDGIRCFATSFDQLGSRLFIECMEPLPVVPRPVQATDKLFMKLAGEWDFQANANTLVLDNAEYAIDGEKFKEKEFFIFIDNAVRDKLGIPRRGGAMAQPYTRQERAPEKFAGLTLRYEFTLAGRGIALALAVENPELYTFECNSKSFLPEISGSWIDPALKTFIIPAEVLQDGKNELVLTTSYHEYHPGVEAIFILGDFAADRAGVIRRQPEKVVCGDLGKQGFTFYADNFTYRKKFVLERVPGEPLFLAFGSWRGAMLGVSVNNSPEKLLPFPPYKAEISPYLKAGENQLSITVYGHRRNALGPFYMNEATPFWNGPLQFKTRQQSEKQLVPFGLLDEVKIVF